MVIFSNQCVGKSREAVKPFRAIGSGIFSGSEATAVAKKVARFLAVYAECKLACKLYLRL